MRDSGLDLFDPTATVVDSAYTDSPTGGRDPDSGFAFNDSNFSDRLLRIEIVADPAQPEPGSEACKTLADWARRSKRRRGDVPKEENDMHHSFAALDINNCPEEQILDGQPEAEDGAGDENPDEEEILTIEDLPSGKMLEIKRRHLYWTPCAAHCIDLMLEDIGTKVSKVRNALKKAIFINGYIYNNHVGVVNMMRRFTNQRNLHRPAVTRFATSFITLSQMHKQRNNLRKMVISGEWNASKWAKEAGGKKIASYILQETFWKNVLYALKLSSPLVKVLRMVDGEKKPPMGYIYEAMDRAKEAIATSFHNKEEDYKQVFEMIDRRWECQLHRPLHAAGYYLNPEIYYDNRLAIENCSEVVKGLYDCIERLVPDRELQDKVNTELSEYSNARGLFGHAMAIRQRKKRSPVTAVVDEDANSDDSNWSEDGSRVIRVKTLHISSPILAAKSPFFYKLFSNGMMESEQRHVTLRINASEEAALMELLNFMYSNTLSNLTAPALLDVLMAADKFEVASCMRHCSRALRNLTMTPESALLYLDLPSSVLMADAVQPLTDAAKQFLAACYKDISKFQDEVMKLPLAGIEAILSSDDLQVASEDAVYDFALKWARTHYPKLEERRNILCSRLGRHIRFPYMTSRKLRKVLMCNDFDHDFATKTVLDALFFKAEAPHRQRIHAVDESSSSRRFVERTYKYRPVKVVEFELPRQQCVVYLDLKWEECGRLFPSGRVYSQAFHLGGQGFFLSAHCNMDQGSSFHCFWLFLGMQEKGSVSFAVDYEFAARSKPTEEYVSKYKGNYTFTGGKAVGYRNLFGIPWTSFMAEDSLCFINGVLHLRAELTMKRGIA